MNSRKLAVMRFCVECIAGPSEAASPAEQAAAFPSRDCALCEHRPSEAELAAEGLATKI